ncbi:MAG: HAMP domain-containing sensor histidine kinase [Clostridia bacterium]|jgi:signal transduction histidine kinase|nr:HAMP domain-containing sensor histidine kinase [Clostridia bacterium]
MKKKISNQFFTNYLVVFVLVFLATGLAVSLLSFASQLTSDLFAKNKYPANSIMQDDYKQIDAAPVVQNGGSVQVIDKEYRVVLSEGKDAISKKQLTAGEFTDFLMWSKSKDTPFHHDILYNPQGEFWLVVTFPASIRIDFGFTINKNAATGDFDKAALVFGIVIVVYLLMLAVLTVVYSKITASQITVPLQKLCDGTRLLRGGDYSARVDLRLKNEFAELQNTFNDMAARIEREVALRKKSEEDRRRLILDISHDLKNPMSSIQGYAERLCQKADMNEQERSGYLQIIHQNSQRANRLLNELFELSKMDSPDFSLKLIKADICETLRQLCGELVPQLERAGFEYEFNIPEDSFYVMLDSGHFGRIIQNLADNAVRYNPSGTTLTVSLTVQNNEAVIEFSDDGVGIPAHLARDIFKPFVRADDSRNSETGGSGLGLSIAKKIAEAHGGGLTLFDGGNKGCAFRITLPTI